MTDSTLTATTELHRWTRATFERLGELGVFTDTRVELLDGYILTMSPQSSRHALAIRKIESELRARLPTGHEVRSQMPLALDRYSEPEPDVAVVDGQMDDYRDAHPRTALLVVEVAYSSTERDQGLKKLLYARNQIPEYWIVNLETACLEVYRRPREGDYAQSLILRAGEQVQAIPPGGPLLEVARLLP